MWQGITKPVVSFLFHIAIIYSYSETVAYSD